MADHKHGEMDTTSQEKTYDGFIKFTTYSVVAIVGLFLFMAVFAI